MSRLIQLRLTSSANVRIAPTANRKIPRPRLIGGLLSLRRPGGRATTGGMPRHDAELSDRACPADSTLGGLAHEGEFMVGTVRLAVIPGDGIGPEVVDEALKVLDAATAGSDARFVQTRFSLGAARYLETGDVLTDDDLTAIRQHDAILLGAVGGTPGDPRLAGANIERGLLLKLRFDLDHYVNLRPSVLYPGVTSPLANPGEVDFIVVREGTEGPHVGNGGAIRVGTPAEVANEVSVNTAYGVERVVRYAFALASARRRRFALEAHGRRRRSRASGGRGRLPPRRRGDHLPRHGSC